MKARLLLIISVLLSTLLSLKAQDITPVDIDRTRPEQPRLHYYDKHGNKLDEPVMFLTETDTVEKPKPGSPWPVFNGITVGVNFFDVAMLIAGQSYASFDLSAAVSIRNWFFPTIEAGVGYSDNHGVDSDLNYRTKVSPYLKVGIDYNFLYKSTPDYMAGLGIRFGFARPSYEITGASVSSGYWGENYDLNITGQKVTSCYGEVLAAVRVKLWKRLAMGWSVRYRFNIKTGDGSNSTPWFIPGYGGNSPLTATFSLFYTFGQKMNKLPEIEN